MRPSIVLLAVACALVALALALIAGRGGPAGEPAAVGGPLTRPQTAPPADPQESAAAAESAAELAPPAPSAPARPAPLPDPPPLRGAPVPLAGDVYLELEDGTLLPGVEGRCRLRILAGGEVEELDVAVVAGRFATSVPERSLLTLLGGELGGEEVRFAVPASSFEPRTDRMAWVGRARPSIVLRVVAAGTGADLVDVTLREVEGPGGAHLVSGPAATPGEARPGPSPPLLSGATSPVRVPWVDLGRPLWLEVSAPGRAPARALVDPRGAGERRFELSPAAGPLKVRVTGPGRGRVEGLVVQRLLPEDRRPVAAHAPCTPLGSRAPDPVELVVEGLAADRHLVRVTWLDRAQGGAVRDLASEEVALEVAAPATLVLWVPGP